MKIYITAIPDPDDDLEWDMLTGIARNLMKDEVPTRLTFTNMPRETRDFVRASEL